MSVGVFPTSYYACTLLQPRGVPTTMSPLRPVVLVIDDDEAVHDALRLVLEDDYEVISAFAGEQGLAELAGTSCTRSFSTY